MRAWCMQSAPLGRYTYKNILGSMYTYLKRKKSLPHGSTTFKTVPYPILFFFQIFIIFERKKREWEAYNKAIVWDKIMDDLIGFLTPKVCWAPIKEANIQKQKNNPFSNYLNTKIAETYTQVYDLVPRVIPTL